MYRAKVWMQSTSFQPDESGNMVLHPKTGVLVEDEGNFSELPHYSIIQQNEETHNTLLLGGRRQLGLMITGLASGGFLWVAAGSGSQAVDSVNDDRMGGYPGSSPAAFEYIANGVRKLLQSTTYGGDLTANDWVAETYTDGLGNVYREKCLATVTYGPSDANGTASGVPLRRYGFCSHSPTPATVTGISGLMFNEMVDTADQNLTDVNQVQVRFVIRI